MHIRLQHGTVEIHVSSSLSLSLSLSPPQLKAAEQKELEAQAQKSVWQSAPVTFDPDHHDNTVTPTQTATSLMEEPLPEKQNGNGGMEDGSSGSHGGEGGGSGGQCVGVSGEWGGEEGVRSDSDGGEEGSVMEETSSKAPQHSHLM